MAKKKEGKKKSQEDKKAERLILERSPFFIPKKKEHREEREEGNKKYIDSGETMGGFITRKKSKTKEGETRRDIEKEREGTKNPLRSSEKRH